MEPDTPMERNPLLPERHPQQELFICDVADAMLKDVMQQMEHPFFSLSTNPDTTVRRYEHNGRWIKITPSVAGLATIFDKDILIYCISQIIHKLSRGEKVSRRVKIYAKDLLIFTNKGTGGKDYKSLHESMERLRGTVISTNIKTGNGESTSTFGLIESSEILRTQGLDGRMISCEVVLSDWIFDAIEAKEVLTLHRDYFRLRRPIERRIYELARKHCGRQESWSCSLDLLLKKSGSRGSLKRFRSRIRHLVQHDHLPEYRVSFDDEADMVTFTSRVHDAPFTGRRREIDETRVSLSSDVYDAARSAAPGYDVYALEQEWRAWAAGKGPLKNPEAAFVGFCRKKAQTAPLA